MEISIIFAVAMALLTLLVGVVATMFVMRARIALAEANGKSTGESERATLIEQGKSLAQEITSLKARLSSEEQASKVLQGNLEDVSRKAAQFEERSSRIPEMEATNKASHEAVERVSKELAAARELSATLQAECDARNVRINAFIEEKNKFESALAEKATANNGMRDELSSVKESNSALSAEASAINKRLAELEAENSKYSSQVESIKSENARLMEASGALSAELAAKKERISELDVDLGRANSSRDAANKQSLELSSKVAELTSSLESERERSKRDLALLSEAKEQLSNQFEVLANKILDDKSKKFTDQNQTNLSQLLAPFQENIKAFQAKVEEVYVNEGKDRSALAEQVKMLTQLNNTLSQDTQNLALALKGDRKAQGNWGEIILDEVLERAGLLRGQHYERQGSVKTEDGQSHVIPDVVVHLPGDRHLVIDSKMTLPDYRAYASSENEAEREAALKRHLLSIRNHIKVLSDKNYQSLYELKSLDFVIMFIPLEPAFTLAVTNDQELFQNAWEKNVLLVSPSTLLFVVRTVAYLWRQEGLSRNAKEISSRGAELYDKLVGFVVDLQKVGERIQQAQDSYGEAKKKFSEGTGNVIRQAEMLKQLGVKPTKAIPTKWADVASDVAADEAAQISGSNPDPGIA